MADTSEQIRGILDPILASQGLSLWEMEFQKHGPSWLLRIYIDREGTGMTLDEEDVIPHAYTLEVSSPGLDRRLSKPEHFARFTGSAVKVKTYQLINGQKVFEGR